MSKIAGMIINFLKNFLIKYLGTLVLEKILILLLEELVKRTDSDIDDKIYKIIFEDMDNHKKQINNYKIIKIITEKRELIAMEIDIIKTTLSILAFGVGYHKYMLSLLENKSRSLEEKIEKKIDKEVWEREKNLFLKLQTESNKNLADSLKRIDERIGRIEERLMN